MTKYLVPVCYINKSKNKIEEFLANSLNDCREQIMNKIMEKYDCPNFNSYKEFVSYVDTTHDIIIGEIRDSEEIC